MNKRFVLAALAASLLGTAACSNPTQPKSDIGLVDVPRITANWPKFQNYQNQLNADAATIQQSRASDAEKRRQLDGLNAKFQRGQAELTNDVRDAAQQVANDKHLQYVFTRQYVGYGGVDITPDVEKVLKIEEKATPKP
jgi:Skp family chaperone for outer membrane proteins